MTKINSDPAVKKAQEARDAADKDLCAAERGLLVASEDYNAVIQAHSSSSGSWGSFQTRNFARDSFEEEYRKAFRAALEVRKVARINSWAAEKARSEAYRVATELKYEEA